jgi:hypothetical protein
MCLDMLNESLDVQPRLFCSHGPNKGAPERFPGGAPVPTAAQQAARAAAVGGLHARRARGGGSAGRDAPGVVLGRRY